MCTALVMDPRGAGAGFGAPALRRAAVVLVSTFTASNFEITGGTSAAPEPSDFLMMTGAGLIGSCFILRRVRGTA